MEEIDGSRANFFCIYPNRLKIKGCRLDFGRPEQIFQNIEMLWAPGANFSKYRNVMGTIERK